MCLEAPDQPLLDGLIPNFFQVRAPHSMDYSPTRWPESPRVVMRCAPRAPNVPNHLGLVRPSSTDSWKSGAPTGPELAARFKAPRAAKVERLALFGARGPNLQFGTSVAAAAR